MNSKKILLVKDELIIAGDLQHELETAGSHVIGTATKGEEALELTAQDTPDLVLNEAFSNAIKYACPITTNCQISVEMTISAADKCRITI